jgi:excisionase family DNA binding protein
MTALTAEERDRVRQALGHGAGLPRITTEDGRVLDLPDSVARALLEVLQAAADGERPVVLRSPEHLTTEQAAAVLNVSRPTVIRMIESGQLPAHKVGTHRRLTLEDVLAYREQMIARRRDALDEMTRQAEDLGLYDE